MTKINRIFDLLELYRNGPFSEREVVLAGKQNGRWKKWSASAYAGSCDRLSAGLLHAGVRPGTKVATILHNCPEWNFLDMALMQIGAIQVPLYPTIAAEHFRFLFAHADVEFVFVYDEMIYERIREKIAEFSQIKAVFSIRPAGNLPLLESLMLNTDPALAEEVRRISAGIKSADMATIIYTSGTTGTGKGVMLSHHNFISNFTATSEILASRNVEKALSFLPLCHVYERMLNYNYQYLGIQIYYAESFDAVKENILKVQPDIICAVPRVLEKIHDRIISAGRNLDRPGQYLFFWAYRLACRFQLDGAKGRWYEFRRRIADRLIYRHWRASLGGKLRFVVCGAASLRPRLARVFWAAGIQVVEGYGLTETSPVIAVGTFDPGGIKFGTVGPPLKNVEVKIAEDGEILCKGPNVMMGYYKDEELTREVIDADGWFHTGDIGMLDEGKYLKITDRKKEIFKTSGGKYIAPQVIENRFRESEFIENLIVIGENRHFPAALIVPAFEYLRSWCAIKGIEAGAPEQMIKLSQVTERIGSEVERLNSYLGKTERIKQFRLVPEEFSVETGELSPTLKLRRTFIQNKYSSLITDIYGDDGMIERWNDGYRG